MKISSAAVPGAAILPHFGRSFEVIRGILSLNMRFVFAVISLLVAGSFFTTRVQALTLGEALDETNFVWTTGGTSNIAWTAQSYPTAPAYDEVDSAQCGTLTANQETWLQTSVVGPGTVAFWWKAASDNSTVPGDQLQFSINGNVSNFISGAVDWQYQSYNVPAGTNTLKWRYVKDAAIN